LFVIVESLAACRNGQNWDTKKIKDVNVVKDREVTLEEGTKFYIPEADLGEEARDKHLLSTWTRPSPYGVVLSTFWNIWLKNKNSLQFWLQFSVFIIDFRWKQAMPQIITLVILSKKRNCRLVWLIFLFIVNRITVKNTVSVSICCWLEKVKYFRLSTFFGMKNIENVKLMSIFKFYKIKWTKDPRLSNTDLRSEWLKINKIMQGI